MLAASGRRWVSALAAAALQAVLAAADATVMVGPTLLDAGNGTEPVGMIRVANGTFADDGCREFVPVGWNIWNDPFLGWAVDALGSDSGKAAAGMEKLHTVFDNARDNGFNLMRMFGFGVNGKNVLQTAPGQYDETVFRALDLALDFARQYGVKIIWAFTTHWQKEDGMPQYLQWCGLCASDTCTAQEYDQFWGSECARGLLRDHVATVANRVNTVNGRLYKEDDTIFAWNIYNEPRCPGTQQRDDEKTERCFEDVLDWTVDLARWIKGQDPNHMLTWGQEGFFIHNSSFVDANPWGVPSNVQPGWSGYVGQDFEAHHALDEIDFAAFHMWPDNWAVKDVEWVGAWLRSHMEAAEKLGKPLLLQEFGKRALPGSEALERDPYYAAVYDIVEASVEAGGVLKGDLFWEWDPLDVVRVGDVRPDGTLPPSANAVKNAQSTFQMVVDHSAFMAGFQGRPVPGCEPRSSASDSAGPIAVTG